MLTIGIIDSKKKLDCLLGIVVGKLAKGLSVLVQANLFIFILENKFLLLFLKDFYYIRNSRSMGDLGSVVGDERTD